MHDPLRDRSTPQASSRAPSEARLVRTLKDGYWDRTEVIELPDGSLRVRKRSKGATASGPWGVRSLRREIHYLSSLPEPARPHFPPVLAAWDDAAGATPDVGYEMPFYAEHVDAGSLARKRGLTQAEINAFQDTAAEALFTHVHEPVPAGDDRLSAHVVAVVEQALRALDAVGELAPLIRAETLELNGAPLHGPRAVFARIAAEPTALALLDAGPCVRLHGDFFLENILWRPAAATPTTDAPRLLFVDPVSVAGVVCGPPVFDLVKYESYGTGELLALRSELLEISTADATGAWHYRVRWEDPGLAPFRVADWHTRVRARFEANHGAVDRRLYHLIDGYFSLAMAVNTSGRQRLGRVLKATIEFNAVLAQM